MLWSPCTRRSGNAEVLLPPCCTRSLWGSQGSVAVQGFSEIHPFRAKESGFWKCAKSPAPILLSFSQWWCLAHWKSLIPHQGSRQPHLHPASSRKAGLDKLQRCLPTRTVLWLCANLGEKEGTQQTSYSLKEGV